MAQSRFNVQFLNVNNMKQITQDTIEFIRQNVDTSNRRALAKQLGISRHIFYKILRQHNIEYENRFKYHKTHYEELVAKHYPNMSGYEIAKKFGVSATSVFRWARKLGVKHTLQTVNRLKDKRIASASYACDAQARKKATETMRRKRRADILRLMSGLPQETNLKISFVPKRTMKCICRLKSKYNYFQDVKVGGDYTLYYDSDTTRSPREDYYVRRYRLAFVQA